MSSEEVKIDMKIDDKEENISEVEKSNKDEPMPGNDVEVDDTSAISNEANQKDQPEEANPKDQPEEANSSNSATNKPEPVENDNQEEVFVRLSHPNINMFESLCYRVMDDLPDEEDLLPPVVDFTVEHFVPGWYHSFCASPDCHGES